MVVDLQGIDILPCEVIGDGVEIDYENEPLLGKVSQYFMGWDHASEFFRDLRLLWFLKIFW